VSLGASRTVRPTKLAVVACALAVSSCGGGTSAGASRPAAISGAAACSPQAVHHESPPSWTGSAEVRGPYAVANGGAAVGFFFRLPLRAGHPRQPANKILWVMRLPREGSRLTITARSPDDPGHTVVVRQAANSSPGEIYPTNIDLPTKGCWRLNLQWASHRTRMDVAVS